LLFSDHFAKGACRLAKWWRELPSSNNGPPKAVAKPPNHSNVLSGNTLRRHCLWSGGLSVAEVMFLRMRHNPKWVCFSKSLNENAAAAPLFKLTASRFHWRRRAEEPLLCV
jgi:hypothetical protein